MQAITCMSSRALAGVLPPTAPFVLATEWTRHLGKQGASQLRRVLTRLREITDPHR
jgi:hypothetical protein